MAGGNIRAGGAFVEIFGKDMLDKSLKAASVKFQAFGASVMKIGAGMATASAAAAAPLVALTKSFVDTASAVDDAAQRTGMTTNAISELGYAAKLSGSDMQTMEKGIRRMQQTLVDAADGGKTAQDSLARLGLTASDLSSLSPDKQFELISDRLAGISDPAIRAATAMDIFGRSGADLLPLMSSGAEGIQAMRQAAIQAGASLDQVDASAGAKLGDILDQLSAAFTKIGVEVGASLAPALINVGETILRVARGIGEFLNENREAIATVGKLVAGVGAAGIALTAIGGIISGVGVILGSMPLLLGAVAGAFLGLTKTGRALAKNLFESFQGIATSFGDTLGLLRDLLLSGDVAGAAEVMTASLKLAFERGMFAVQEIWAGVSTAFLSTWTDITASVRSVWSQTQEWLTKKLLQLWGLIDRTFDAAAAIEIAAETGEQDRRAITSEAAAENAERELRAGKELNKARAKLAALEAERAKLMEDARASIKDTPKSELPELPKFDAISLDSLAAASAQQRRASEGTFLASAATRLGGAQTVDNKILAATEEVVAAVERVGRTIENNPLAFA